jgi:ubiquinone/menaquinone biosynthesis C-methylase UbiE
MGPTFGGQAAAYDRWYRTPLGQLVDRVEQEAIFALLPEISGLRLLEVGCGTGNLSLALARRGAGVVGLDASGPMLARARDKSRPEGPALAWVQGLASLLPFGDASFDGVLCVLALDFMRERETVLQEMVRVLRAGGFVAVAVLNRYSPWTLKRLIRSWFRPSLWRQVHFLTARGLRRLLSGCPELADLRRGQAVFFPPWKNRRLLRYYPYLEKLGKKLHLPTGACLVMVARKGITPP